MGVFDNRIGHIISLNFSSHEEMIKAALFWNLEEYQLESGFFRGSMDAIHTSHIQIANVIRSNGFFARGNIPKHTYVFTTVESEGKVTHNGSVVYPDEIILLTDSDEIDLIVSSAENDVNIAIDQTFFNNAYEKYFKQPFQYDHINKRMQLKEGAIIKFRVSIKRILAKLINQNDQLKSDPEYCDNIEHEILSALFESFDISRRREKTLQSDIQANHLRKCIEEDYHKSFNFKEMCVSEKFADRTIRTGFNNLFGFSPKKYQTQYRLGKVHHELMKSNGTSESVSNIAFKHGFNHMGRFSESYKKMFLKTPSQTLKDSSHY